MGSGRQQIRREPAAGAAAAGMNGRLAELGHSEEEEAGGGCDHPEVDDAFLPSEAAKLFLGHGVTDTLLRAVNIKAGWIWWLIDEHAGASGSPLGEGLHDVG